MDGLPRLLGTKFFSRNKSVVLRDSLFMHHFRLNMPPKRGSICSSPTSPRYPIAVKIKGDVKKAIEKTRDSTYIHIKGPCRWVAPLARVVSFPS